MPAVNATLHNPELGIADLPDASSALIMGATYGLVVENPPSRYPLMSSLIRDTWQKGLPTTLITPADPASLVQRLSALDFASLPPALERNEVRLLQTQGDIAKKMFRFGGSRLVRELRYFGVPENSLLIFDQADDLFSLHDLSLAMSQIDAVKTWATAANVAVLLMFSGITVSSTYQSTLSGMLDQLAGMARIDTEGEVLSFSLEFWKSVGGAVTHQRFELETLPTGVYRVARHQAKTPSLAIGAASHPYGAASSAQTAHSGPTAIPYTVEPAGHQRTFFYESPRLERLKRSVEGEWHRVEGLAGLLRASRSVPIPYIMLRYGANTDLRSLAEMVNVLRSSRDALAKIIVIEDDASLRYRNEVLLLRLGASLVIQRDTPDIRVPLLMESLVGQVFRGDQAIDFDAALGSVLDVPHKGYLAPALFVSEVAAGLERSAILNTPAVLVSIKVEPDASAFDLLRSSTFIRTGDLATTSPWEILLFLPGCPEAFVPRILASSFPSHALLVPRWDVCTETHRELIRTQIHRFNTLIPADYADLSTHFASDQAPPPHTENPVLPSLLSRPEPVPPVQELVNEPADAITTLPAPARDDAEEPQSALTHGAQPPAEQDAQPSSVEELPGVDLASAALTTPAAGSITEHTARPPDTPTSQIALQVAPVVAPPDAPPTENTANLTPPAPVNPGVPNVQTTNHGSQLGQPLPLPLPLPLLLPGIDAVPTVITSTGIAPEETTEPALSRLAASAIRVVGSSAASAHQQLRSAPRPLVVNRPAHPPPPKLQPPSLFVEVPAAPTAKPLRMGAPGVSKQSTPPASTRPLSMKPLKPVQEAPVVQTKNTFNRVKDLDSPPQQPSSNTTIKPRPRATRVSEIQRLPVYPPAVTAPQSDSTAMDVLAHSGEKRPLFRRNKTSGAHDPTKQLGLFTTTISTLKSRGIQTHSSSPPNTRLEHAADRTTIKSSNRATIPPASRDSPSNTTDNRAGRAIRVSSDSIREHRRQIHSEPDAVFSAVTDIRPAPGRRPR